MQEIKPKNNNQDICMMWINPLQFIEVDKPWSKAQAMKVDLNSILRFLSSLETDCTLNALVSRYREISIEKERLFAVPGENQIMNKLVWPLRHAKGSYMLGNYLGTIALSGLAAEMLAMLIFESFKIALKEKPFAEAGQKVTSEKEFERWGQEKRIKKLLEYKLITKDMKQKFDNIREKRNKYLHLWSQADKSQPRDAISAYKSAVSLVATTIVHDVKDGIIYLNPLIAKYLQRSGVYISKDGLQR
jgi:hypothetical protein